ncbi:GNAT family N-acetyltransferase [Peribacillus sp. NPDC096448]|uniref:GNAT family N-acetyltransferase n=1 Tax=Peribacillus sp. NPDC096448 TaxID=3364395 RepID=UPI0037F92067
MFPILETKRLVLREMAEGDAADILKCFSNPDVLRYYGQTPLTNTDQVKKLIKKFSKNFEVRHGIKWGIELKGKDGIIGTIGFQEWSQEHKRAELSYALFPKYWGNGYATEAVSKVISYGFKELELTRIGAIVFIENKASNKLLTNLGFKKEGILRNYLYQNDVSFDTYLYSLLR